MVNERDIMNNAGDRNNNGYQQQRDVSDLHQTLGSNNIAIIGIKND
jgi:hypothetical protein